MNPIEALISSLNNIKDNYLMMASEVLEENADRIEDLNLMQLHDGERPDGSQIEPFYTPRTVAIKKSKGQPYDRVTARDTGAFYEGIYAEVFQDKLEITGTDAKTAKLQAKYGPLIGIGDKGKVILIEDILTPGLGQKFIDALPQ